MTDNQYQELAEFLGRKFDGIDRRFDGIDRRLGVVERRLEGLEQRMTAVEVGLESLRDEVRLVAEGVTTNSARIDRLEATMNRRFDRVEQLWLEHEGRIQVLEA